MKKRGICTSSKNQYKRTKTLNQDPKQKTSAVNPDSQTLNTIRFSNNIKSHFTSVTYSYEEKKDDMMTKSHLLSMKFLYRLIQPLQIMKYGILTKHFK